MRIPTSPPRFDLDELKSQLGEKEFYQRLLNTNPTDDRQRYLSWDEFRRRTPPEGLTPEQAWFFTRVARRHRAANLPFEDKAGIPFSVTEIGPLRNLLHRIDSEARGQLAANSPHVPSDQAEKYFVKSLIEEPFSSSVYEGAITTRERAKEMIAEGKEAQTRDERMVLNNYRAMQLVKENLEEELTPQLIFDIHSVITEGTLDKDDAAGRLRRGEEDIAIWNDGTGELIHAPPNASKLPDRLRILCEFANEDYTKAEPFLNPVTRAILLHFMIGYDHPFVDGNGRTARALFYWYVLKHGYWLLEYISISKIIREEKGRGYERAYLYSETDDGDATYFVLYHLEVVWKALKELKIYLSEKAKEASDVTALISQLKRGGTINHRQASLLAEAAQHPFRRFTISQHQRMNGVVYLTARKDLEQLFDDGYLKRKKEGKQWQFSASPKLVRTLRSQATP